MVHVAHDNREVEHLSLAPHGKLNRVAGGEAQTGTPHGYAAQQNAYVQQAWQGQYPAGTPGVCSYGLRFGSISAFLTSLSEIIFLSLCPQVPK